MHVCGECGQRYERDGFCTRDGSPLAATDDELLGAELGRYRIARLLGEGGMGRVYMAVQPAIGSRVAIKVLSEQCARNAELVERFFSEARAVNLIRHESIVNVLDMEHMPNGRPYIVMELIDGETLTRVIRRSPPPLGGVVHALTEVLSALDAAHAIGIVHRDLKPDNILITGNGHAKVLDFGIAKLAPSLADAASPRTRTGALLGTPAYMAPEQISGGGDVDARSDLYAAGVVAFEAMTGQQPFRGATMYDLMRAHIEQPPPSPRALRAEIPPAIEHVILTALAKQPGARFQTATAMANALQHAATELAPDQWQLLSSRRPSSGTLTPPPSGPRRFVAPSRDLATRPAAGAVAAERAPTRPADVAARKPTPPAYSAVVPPHEPAEAAVVPPHEPAEAADRAPNAPVVAPREPDAAARERTAPADASRRPADAAQREPNALVVAPRRIRRALVLGIAAVAIAGVATALVVGLRGGSDTAVAGSTEAIASREPGAGSSAPPPAPGSAAGDSRDSHDGSNRAPAMDPRDSRDSHDGSNRAPAMDPRDARDSRDSSNRRRAPDPRDSRADTRAQRSPGERAKAAVDHPKAESQDASAERVDDAATREGARTEKRAAGDAATREVAGSAKGAAGDATAASPAGGHLVIKPPFDPRRFDVFAFLPHARALARQVLADAELVDFEVFPVAPDGAIDLTHADKEHPTVFRFRSEHASGNEWHGPCVAKVTVTAARVEAALDTTAFCFQQLASPTRCALSRLWDAARTHAALGDSPATVSFAANGWTFSNHDLTWTIGACR